MKIEDSTVALSCSGTYNQAVIFGQDSAISNSVVTVTALGEWANGLLMDHSSNAEITITDSTVTIDADQQAMKARYITIENNAVTASSVQQTAIYADKELEISETSKVIANGYYSGLWAGSGGISMEGSVIDATGNNDVGIFAKGEINIDGGYVHATGKNGLAAIAARVVQEDNEATTSKINVQNIAEKNGGKIAFSEWFIHPNKDTLSWTSFIEKDQSQLQVNDNGGMTNTLSEIWLAPAITFDANGGSVTPASATTGADGKLATLPTPTHSGYSFDGWFIEANSGTAITSLMQTPPFMAIGHTPTAAPVAVRHRAAVIPPLTTLM